MVEVLGYVGAFLFAFCGLPQCIMTYRTKKADDLSWWFLIMWYFGLLFTFMYVLLSNVASGEYQYPLLGNYVFNFVLLNYLCYAKWRY